MEQVTLENTPGDNAPLCHDIIVVPLGFTCTVEAKEPLALRVMKGTAAATGYDATTIAATSTCLCAKHTNSMQQH